MTGEEIDKIITSYREKKDDTGFSVYVPYDKFEDKGYSLSAGLYFEVKLDRSDITIEEFNSNIQKLFDEIEILQNRNTSLYSSIKGQIGAIKYEED